MQLKLYVKLKHTKCLMKTEFPVLIPQRRLEAFKISIWRRMEKLDGRRDPGGLRWMDG